MDALQGFSKIPYVHALIIIVITVITAKVVDIFIDRVLLKLAQKTHMEADDLIVSIIHKPICGTVILQGFREAIPYLELLKRLSIYADALLVSGIVIAWAITGVRLSSLFMERAVSKISDITGMGREIIPLFETIVRVLIVGTGFILILSVWNINITPFLASAGIFGVAVALAAKETLANFFGGISIFMDKPYKIGDYIILDGDERGEVVEIGVRSTRIKTRDDVVISIPNSIMANSKIVNESVPVERFRVRIGVGVAYGSDIEKGEALLVRIASDNPQVVEDPAPRARFRAFGDSALEFELLCWIKDPAYKGLVTHELNKTIYKSFAEEGLTIPFPQRDVHLYHKKD
ncbi:MAG TPA: mechanosensitive ion channel [Proteobacteria bacterium]|nr:mechanosensitive ion channel [Pseudomonadota bacterium]